MIRAAEERGEGQKNQQEGILSYLRSLEREVDTVDMQILKYLAENATASFTDIRIAVNKIGSTTAFFWDRFNKLRAEAPKFGLLITMMSNNGGKPLYSIRRLAQIEMARAATPEEIADLLSELIAAGSPYAALLEPFRRSTTVAASAFVPFVSGGTSLRQTGINVNYSGFLKRRKMYVTESQDGETWQLCIGMPQPQRAEIDSREIVELMRDVRHALDSHERAEELQARVTDLQHLLGLERDNNTSMRNELARLQALTIEHRVARATAEAQASAAAVVIADMQQKIYALEISLCLAREDGDEIATMRKVYEERIAELQSTAAPSTPASMRIHAREPAPAPGPVSEPEPVSTPAAEVAHILRLKKRQSFQIESIKPRGS